MIIDAPKKSKCALPNQNITRILHWSQNFCNCLKDEPFRCARNMKHNYIEPSGNMSPYLKSCCIAFLRRNQSNTIQTQNHRSADL